MKIIIIESPYAGDVAANTVYARLCLKDSLMRDEAPFASHLLYTQDGVLDDLIPKERNMGIEAGLAFSKLADLAAVYTDLGISKGMKYGIARHLRNGTPVQFRTLKDWR